MWAKQKRSGFTIVELLIVIIVIAILAVISIVVYSGIQERSRASTIITDIKQLDKAFRLLATADGRSTWWIDTDFTGTGNPSINTVLSNSNLKDYFQKLSQATTDSTSAVRYDNDNDIYNGCSSSATSGVNIYFYDITQSLAQKIDSSIDDGNLDCGTITWGNPNMRYSLSRGQSL